MADRLNHTSNAQPIKVEPTRKLCTELAEVVLFPRQSYEAEFIQPRNSIGFAFDAQLGEHAIGSDQITPFFATANSLAYIPAGCDIYSRSRTGGEYLKICLSPDPVDFDAITPKPIPFNNVISSQAVRMANRLRMAILGGTKPDAFWVELVLQNMLRITLLSQFLAVLLRALARAVLPALTERLRHPLLIRLYTAPTALLSRCGI